MVLFNVSFIFLPVSWQWWMGRPVRGGGGLWAGSRGRNHHEATVRGCQVFWWLLPEAASGHQHQEPLVCWVLAVPLPVPPTRPPTGEQELQESLHWWVLFSRVEDLSKIWDKLKGQCFLFEYPSHAFFVILNLQMLKVKFVLRVTLQNKWISCISPSVSLLESFLHLPTKGDHGKLYSLLINRLQNHKKI